jgi:hypothetical protein
MLIATSEGQGWRYEVVDRAEGYLVVPRDLDTGAVEPESGMLFRTAPVAFAFADLSAAFDRLASARMAGEDTHELSDELARERDLYAALSRRLGDEGLSERLLSDWTTSAETDRRRYH